MTVANRFIVLGVAFIAVFSACSARQTPGEHWEPVERAGLAGTSYLDIRDPRTLNLRASGDFNGDGHADKAYIAKNDASSEYAVIVCLSRPSEACERRIVARGPSEHIATLGVDTLTETEARELIAVQREEDDMGLDELLSGIGRPGANDLLQIFAFESSMSIYYWDGSKLRRVWIAD